MARSKKIFLRLVVFIGIFVAMNFLMSFFYLRFARTHDFRLYDLDKKFESSNQKLNYLFMGDSHVFMAVEPDSFGVAFDYSSPGEHPIQTYYKLKYILDNHVRDFDTLVLNLDMHQYRSFSSSEFKNSYYWVQYVNFWELGTEQSNRSMAVSQFIKGKFFPYYDGIKNFFYFVRYDNVANFTLQDFSKTPNHQAQARLVASKHLNYEDYLDPICVRYFGKLFALLKKYNKPVVFVKLPVTEDYFNEAKTIIPVDTFYQKLYATMDVYKDKVKVIDDQSLFFGEDELFCDPHHVNAKGKKLFSHHLKEQLAQIHSGNSPE